MAAKAEVLTGTTINKADGRKGTRAVLRAVAHVVAEWGRRGQLGSSYNTEMSRLTGGRC